MKFYLLIIFCGLSILVKGQNISTYAGNGTNTNSGDGGTALNAGIYSPASSVFDQNGNLYITSYLGHKIRKINNQGIIATYAGTGGLGGYNGDGGLADTSKIKNPAGIVIDSVGNVFFADLLNHRIRRIDANTDIITTVVGTGLQGFAGDGGSAEMAQLNMPNSLCFDKLGNLYISDANNYRIRKVDLQGIITTVIGAGVPGNSGDGGLGINATINLPVSIIADDSNNIFIADVSNGSNCIRKLSIQTGLMSSIAGTGNAPFNGDNIPATAANISPEDIKFNSYGDLFIADRFNSRVRQINMQTGIITTVAGNGTTGYSGDGGLATLAQLNGVGGITFDSCNNLYINEANQGRIRKVTFDDSCGETNTNVVARISLPSFSIYPNPARDEVTVNSAAPLGSVIISNYLGQALIRHNNVQGKTVLDMSALQPGVYFITITDESGRKVTEKIVKE